MKDQWKLNRNENNKKNKKRTILAAAAVILAIVLIVSMAAFLGMIKNGRDKGKPEDNTAVTSNNESAEDNSSETPGEDEAQGTPAPDNSVTPVPAEVAPVDDKEDPQQAGTTGAEVDIKELTGTQKPSGSQNEADTVTYGIDVAKWQGVIDWKKVKASGIDYAIIRVGYRTQVTGVICEDPYAKYNIQQASANGIKLGVYFFSSAVNEQEAKEEAAWVADFIAPYPVTYPVAYNCEGFSDPNNRQYGLEKQERTKIAAAFLNYIKNQGYTPMFYAAKNELEKSAQWDTDTLNSYKIWVAQYPDAQYSDMSKSTYTGKQDMWQYTSMGQVPGIDKAVDINIAYFGYTKTAKAKDATPQKEATADPAALINFTGVNETVTAKLETNLRSVPSSADSATIVAVLKNGDTVTRTGIGDNGWSRVEYKGQTLYAVSSYLTTDLTAKVTQAPPQETGPHFDEVNEQVTAKQETNLRSEPSTASADTIVAVLKNGDTVTRTGIGDNGWSRVEYKGQTLYAVSSYLTTDIDYTQNSTPTVDNPEAGIVFTDVNEQVTAKDKTNLRSVPGSSSADTIVAVLNHGEVAVRTGVGDNGWSRIEYNGQTLYAITSYLTAAEDN